ncbi:MAG: Hexaprenyldihydroxybenzoate methyltransferase, mitochondrial [Bogoriella megaspora]|nr:MAG: Hexaprenyldihydroxybenzoate methyltransferase, mitochondrial [Bogoriella megaspora]
MIYRQLLRASKGTPSSQCLVANACPWRQQKYLHTTRIYRESHSSIDPSEVSHFNALASSWWDPQGPSRLLHLMNPLRHQFIRTCGALQTSKHGQSGLRYLDIGCGGGIFAESAARLPTTESVTAIDPSSEVLDVAKYHARRDPLLAQKDRLNYKNIAIEDLPVPKDDQEKYDIVTLFEVIEHVTDPSAFLEKVLPHIRPGGWLVMSTIARTWTSWFTTKLVAEDVLGMVPRGTHEWSKYINEPEMRNWFGKRNGYGDARSMGVVYVPGLGWREVPYSEQWGNYFFGVRKLN